MKNDRITMPVYALCLAMAACFSPAHAEDAWRPLSEDPPNIERVSHLIQKLGEFWGVDDRHSGPGIVLMSSIFPVGGYCKRYRLIIGDHIGLPTIGASLFPFSLQIFIALRSDAEACETKLLGDFFLVRLDSFSESDLLSIAESLRKGQFDTSKIDSEDNRRDEIFVCLQRDFEKIEFLSILDKPSQTSLLESEIAIGGCSTVEENRALYITVEEDRDSGMRRFRAYIAVRGYFE